MNSASPPAPAAAAPVSLLERTLNDLDKEISFSAEVLAPTHTVVTVDGLDDPGVPTALGRYLVGALAGAVDYDTRLCEALLAHGVDRQAEITRTVISIIGNTNNFDTPPAEQFRDTRRNAWIGEGVGHALLMLAARHESSFVKGRVCALSEVHPDPTRQGLDSVSIYVNTGVLAVAIGESKATCSRGSEELTEAAGIFAAIDDGVYGPDLRSRLAMFRGFLPDELAAQVSDKLWSDSSCYLPMIVHHDPFDPMARRPKLAQLKPPIERRRVILVQLKDFYAFFDGVADAMRTAIPEMVVA
ncbi:MAG: hypothetical protein ACRDPY_41995 [Streptosporangiaceae bacterium]